MDLKNKIVLITGGSSGIGRASALLFAKKGATVIIQARSEEKLKSAATEISQHTDNIHWYSTDLTDPVAVEETAEVILNNIGVPDIVVNSAGLGEWLSVDESSLNHFAQTIESPYLATAYTCKVYYDRMKPRGSGQFITINSAAAYFTFKKAVGYMTARWALRGFMDAFREDVRGSGVDVSSITFAKVDSPYFTNNPISEQRIPKIAKVLLPETTPEGAAKLIVKTAENKNTVVFNSLNLRILAWASQAFPGIFRWVIRVTG